MPKPTNTPMTFGYGLLPTDPKAIAIYKQLGLKGHNGDDYGTGYPVPTYSIVPGTVVTAGEVSDGGGKSVRIRFRWRDGKNYIAQHDHLSRIDVKVGQSVSVGQQVGMTGMTGSATGIHLHFAIRPVSGFNANDGYYGYINPKPFYEGDPTMDIKAVLNALNQAAHGKPMTASVLEEKYNYIVNGGSWNQLIADIFQFSPWYRSLPRILDDVHQAAGVPLEAKKKEELGYALGEGRLALPDLLKDAFKAPSNQPDPAVVEDARKFNEFKALFRGLMS